MQIETKHLKPGMILMEDVLGKSNKPIIVKKTVLTEEHIEFIRKFLINSVFVSPLPGQLNKDKTIKQHKQKSNFYYEFEQIIQHYKKLFIQVRNNIPIVDLYELRKQFIPFFQRIGTQEITDFIYLLDNKPKKESIYYKSVAMSVLAIYIAKGLNYEKKDWLQIGFSALLADCGFAKLPISVQLEEDDGRPTENYRMHPFYSYKLVEHIATLTKNSKIAILQHQERLDGSGYPAQITEGKMTDYAKIISVCDYFYQIEKNELSQINHLLELKKGVKLDKQVVEFLLLKFKQANLH